MGYCDCIQFRYTSSFLSFDILDREGDDERYLAASWKVAEGSYCVIVVKVKEDGSQLCNGSVLALHRLTKQ